MVVPGGRADAKRSESLEVHQTEDKGASCTISSCLRLGYIRLCMRPSPSHSKGRNLQHFCSVWVERVRLSAYKALPMDPVNCFEHKQTDYTKYDELVGALQLSALELAILDCYMNGMKQAEVCAELGINRGTINHRKASIRKRYHSLF